MKNLSIISVLLAITVSAHAHADTVIEVVNVNCGGHKWEPVIKSTTKCC